MGCFFKHFAIFPHLLLNFNKFAEFKIAQFSGNFFSFCPFAFSRAAPMAYGGSQARGLIRAVATGLHHSHSNGGSEPHPRPTPQLTATPDLNPLSKVRD